MYFCWNNFKGRNAEDEVCQKCFEDYGNNFEVQASERIEDRVNLMESEGNLKIVDRKIAYAQ